MNEKQSYRDADDMPTERAVLEREWKAMRLALSMPRAAVEAAQPEAVGEAVAWQWRKRLIGWHEKDEPQYVWTEWEALEPPYMDARELSKTDPANYEIRPLGLLASAPTTESTSSPSDAERADEIVTSLYRRFKEWSKRGFGPEDVTWCEVKAEVVALCSKSKGGEHFNAAIDFAITQGAEAATFLDAWRHGDTTEWPEFAAIDAALRATKGGEL